MSSKERPKIQNGKIYKSRRVLRLFDYLTESPLVLPKDSTLVFLSSEFFQNSHAVLTKYLVLIFLTNKGIHEIVMDTEDFNGRFILAKD